MQRNIPVLSRLVAPQRNQAIADGTPLSTEPRAGWPWIADSRGIAWQLTVTRQWEIACDECQRRDQVCFERPPQRRLCLWCWAGKGIPMTTIWKYECPQEGLFELEMPRHAVPVHVGSQLMRSNPFMWVMVKPRMPLVKYRFQILPTGEEVSSETWNYLGTVIYQDRYDVYHLFQEKCEE